MLPRKDSSEFSLDNTVTVHCSQEEFKRILGSSAAIQIQLLVPSAKLNDIPPPVKKFLMEFLPNPAQLLVNKEFNYLFNNSTKLQIQSLRWKIDVAFPNYIPKRKKDVEEEIHSLQNSIVEAGVLEKCCNAFRTPIGCTSDEQVIINGLPYGCATYILGCSGLVDCFSRDPSCCCGGKALTCMTTSVGGVQACSGPSCCNPIATSYVVGWSVLGCGILSTCCYCFVTSSADTITDRLRNKRHQKNHPFEEKLSKLSEEKKDLEQLPNLTSAIKRSELFSKLSILISEKSSPAPEEKSVVKLSS